MSDKVLTIGHRVRINSDIWDECNGHEAIITGRQSGEFTLLVLKKGTNVPLKKEFDTAIDEIAWLSSEELEFIDDNIKENIGFIDWFEENKEEWEEWMDNQ